MQKHYKNVKNCLAVLLICLGQVTFAQQVSVSGKVTAADDGSGLPGVNVVEKGTSNGAVTDIDGTYRLSVGANATLIFSYVGYESQEIAVGGRGVIDIALNVDSKVLSEIIVVGYGTQQQKDLTSAISTVKSDEILKTPSGQVMQSMQGKVPGLQVVSSGAPGDSPTIRLRGLGSYPGIGNNNVSPLFVVDGMFFDNVDFLNPSDVESISVLKDASSSAIYGVRAANGVVIITTKSGAYRQAAEVTYEGYYGTQVAQNVLKMANAEQFTNYSNETGSPATQSYIQNAMQRYGRSRINPNVPDVNTDWYNEILRPAAIQNHNIGVSGGDTKTTYALGVNYFYQDGILDMKNDYERLNLRAKLDYNANDWLTVGGNVIVSNATKYLQDEAAWSQAYYAVPIMPVYDELNADAVPEPYSSAQSIGYRDGQNPRPTLDLSDNLQRIRKFLANFYVNLDLIPNKLSFRSAYNSSYTFINERNVRLPFFVTNGFNREQASLTKQTDAFVNHIWDNILTYNQSFGDHNLVVMAGTSYRDESWEMLKAGGLGLPDVRENAWYLNKVLQLDLDLVDDDGSRLYGLSYFGRVSYNFKEKYLFYATMRADGTQKYQEKWGYFPALGAGWVLSEENFLKGNNIVNYLKLRAGWGQLGNDKIQTSSGSRNTATVTTGIDGVITSGSITTNTFNYLRWEVVTETNLGVTAKAINNKLSVDADYFIRDTDKAAIFLRAPLTGETYIRNAGSIRNSGFEMVINWSDNLSNGISYNIGANFATLKNEVKDIYGQLYIDGGSAEFLQRTRVGDPLLAFFGYEVAGVYQNAEEVSADPTAVFENNITPGRIVPGDFRYKDQNNDGRINADDRVVLGSYLPSFTYGANFGASYKNFDLSVSLYGQTGNKILNRKRGQVIFTADANVDADLAVNRWHGEGTTNEYPSSAALRKGWNQRMSDFFVEDGSFFRIQNIQVGYNIKSTKVFGVQMPSGRVTLTAERPLTVFNYNGFNPEIANGVDTQTYPIPAVYTMGLNLKF
jgi:TonB-dependent starch-binding outer membrane protein SusC